MRLIDQIWNKITNSQETDHLENLTHLALSGESATELLTDYKEEFDEKNVSMSDLQEYFGLTIVIEASKKWNDGTKFKLLKEAR